MAAVPDARRGPLVFKASIGLENEYLDKRFGDEYKTYKAQVNQLVLRPRSKHE